MRERKNTEIRKLVKMTYREFRPGPLLQKHVECFWTIQSTPAAETLPDRIYPDGCMDIIFNFADPIRNPETQIVNTSRAFVVGNMTTFSAAQATGKFDLLAVRFHPGGIFPFLQMPLHEITDRSVDIAEFHRECLMFQKKETMENDLPVLKGRELEGSLNFFVIVKDVDKLRNELSPEVEVVVELETKFYGE